MIAFCRGCDLGFCERHRDEHDDSCRGEPTEALTREYQALYHTPIPCCVCEGILAPRAAT